MESKMTVNESGEKEWRNKNGKLHRENGPAVIHPNGTKKWWLNGKLHRENGPAIIYSNGMIIWFLNGKRHRENGPARVWPDGQKEWFLNDIRYAEEEWKEEVRKIKLSNLKL